MMLGLIYETGEVITLDSDVVKSHRSFQENELFIYIMIVLPFSDEQSTKCLKPCFQRFGRWTHPSLCSILNTIFSYVIGKNFPASVTYIVCSGLEKN